MNYQLHYDSLINRARIRALSGYKESHHIIPRCIGGTDEKNNLVDLTPEEHYVAHQLLVKIHKGNPKLIYAVHKMCSNAPNQNRSNKMYGWIRRAYSKVISARQKGKKQPPSRGIKHSKTMKEKYANGYVSPLLGTKGKRKQSEETKKKIGLANLGDNNGMRNRVISQEERLKRSAACSGSKNPFYGKKHNDETRLKMRKPKTFENNISPRTGKKLKYETILKRQESRKRNKELRNAGQS